MSTPAKNTEYTFYVTLVDSVTGGFKANPTIAAGDFQISVDGGAYANLTNLPVVTPAGSVGVKIILTAAEMNSDTVTVFCSDVAGAEWDDVFIPVEIPIANTDLIYQAMGGSALTALSHNATLFDQIRNSIMVAESQRGAHSHQPIGEIFYVDPVNGDTHANGNRGGISDPYSLVQDCHDNDITDSNHDLVFLLSGNASGPTTLTEDVTITKKYLFIRGPGRDFIWTRSGNGDTITVEAAGIELSGFQVNTDSVGSGDGIHAEGADFLRVFRTWINDTRGNGIHLVDCDNFIIHENNLQNSGAGGSGHGIVVDAGTGETSSYGSITRNHLNDVQGDGIKLDPTGTGEVDGVAVAYNLIQGATGDGVHVVGTGAHDTQIHDNRFGNNVGLDINDQGVDSIHLNNEQYATAHAGSIHIHTTLGDDTNDGTHLHPVKTVAGAKVLALALGLPSYHVVGNITLDSDHDRWSFRGDSAAFNDVVNLNGMSVDESRFEGLQLAGSATESKVEVLFCDLDDVDSVYGTFRQCGLLNQFKIESLVPRTFVFHHCYSQVEGGANRPILDVTDVAVEHSINFRNYVGGLNVINMVQGKISIDTPGGTIDLQSTVTGGDIVVRGTGIMINNSGASVTVTEGFIDGLDFRLMKQIIGGKAIVSVDDQTITIYDEDDVTVLATYAVSIDGRERTRTS